MFNQSNGAQGQYMVLCDSTILAETFDDTINALDTLVDLEDTTKRIKPLIQSPDTLDTLGGISPCHRRLWPIVPIALADSTDNHRYYRYTQKENP